MTTLEKQKKTGIRSTNLAKSRGAIRRQLEVVYDRMADHTRSRCGDPCGKPERCCKPMFCEMTAQYAREAHNIQLQRTKHPDLPFMGPVGCSVPPYLRPHCTTFACDKHFDDPEFKSHHEWLKAKLDELELAYNGTVTGERRSEPGVAGNFLSTKMQGVRPE